MNVRIHVNSTIVEKMKHVYLQQMVHVLLCTILQERKYLVNNLCAVRLQMNAMLFYFFNSSIVATKNCPKTNNAEVCGSDGETYPSPCYLHKAKVKLAYTGPCRPDQCKGEVCGSTGVTYKSSCHAKTHSVRIDYYGKCFADE